MKKRINNIILTAIIITTIIISIIPASAADGQSYILYIADETIGTTYSEPIEINSIEDYTYLLVDYNTINRQITVYANNTGIGSGPYTTGSYFIYMIQLPQYYYATIEITRGEGYATDMLGYDINHTRYEFDASSYTSSDYTTITIQINSDYDYNDGRDSVLNNPSNYGLYTSTEYNTYGQQRYQSGYGQGYNIGYADGQAHGGYSQAQYEAYGDSEYLRGKADGRLEQTNTDETLVGIGNVIMTGIYNVFMWITGNGTIFGITVISIIGSALIILIVFAIFKIVRG